MEEIDENVSKLKDQVIFYTSGSIHLISHNSTQTSPPISGKGKKLKIVKYREIQTYAEKGLDRQSHV